MLRAATIKSEFNILKSFNALLIQLVLRHDFKHCQRLDILDDFFQLRHLNGLLVDVLDAEPLDVAVELFC